MTYQHCSDTLVRRSARLAAHGGYSLAHSLGRPHNNHRPTEMFLWEVPPRVFRLASVTPDKIGGLDAPERDGLRCDVH